MAKENDKKTINLTTPIIILLIAVAAFFGGMQAKDMLGGKSSGDQTSVKTVPANPNPADTAPPVEETILSPENWQLILTDAAGAKGPQDAPVTIVEFSEYECPFCQRFFVETYQQLSEEYGDKIRYLFHDFPLQFHQNAQKASEAARCAGVQGDYWGMHDALFENHEKWTSAADAESAFADLAAGIGLDQAGFTDCLDSGKFAQAVKDDLALGQKVGVQGTPTFFVNGQKLVGAQPFSSFQALIDAELD